MARVILQDWTPVSGEIAEQLIDTARGPVLGKDMEIRYTTESGDNYHKIISSYRLIGTEEIIKEDVGASILRGHGGVMIPGIMNG